MNRFIYLDIKKCLGCKSCMFACAVEHSESKDRVLSLYETPGPKPRVHLEAVDGRAIPLQCRHCENAPCVAVCPSGAIEKLSTEGPVIINQERCIGCKFCIVVCPFGTISLSRDGRAAVKCDQCVDRQKEGRQPACVEACPTGALLFLTLEEVNAKKRKLTAEREVEALAQAERS